ncbi:MAG: AraC family transcriptional regulator [Clostridiales bacterium]|nr:AraC family transcriptional regulator [Clostridiales bacterium]MCF8021166.1 AraC family transcriptional regulator [Clostridiales bacterium]
MQDLSSKAAYLQGLCKGMNIDPNTNEGKLLTNVVDVLGDFASAIDEMEKAYLHIEDYMESMDDDLYQLEDNICEENGELAEGNYLEVNCPGCGETVCFNAVDLDDEDTVEVTCPNCNTIVFTNEGNYITEASEQFEPATRAGAES